MQEHMPASALGRDPTKECRHKMPGEMGGSVHLASRVLEVPINEYQGDPSSLLTQCVAIIPFILNK